MLIARSRCRKIRSKILPTGESHHQRIFFTLVSVMSSCSCKAESTRQEMTWYDVKGIFTCILTRPNKEGALAVVTWSWQQAQPLSFQA